MQVNTNTHSIKWDDFVQKLAVGADIKAEDIKNVEITKKGELSVTINEDGKINTYRMDPPKLDLPKGVPDGSALQSILAKIGDGVTINYSDKEIQKMLSIFPDLSDLEFPKSTGNMLFDLYSMIALMVQVSQKLRNATRAIRQAENEVQQHTLQMQADQQRSAAMVGLVSSISVAVIQGAVQGFTLGMQARAVGKQTKAMQENDVAVGNTKAAFHGAEKKLIGAKTDVRNAKAYEAAKANFEDSSLKLKTAEDKAGKAGDGVKTAETKYSDAKTKCTTAEKNYKDAETEYNTVKNEKGPESAECKAAKEKYDAAKGEYDAAKGKQTSAEKDLETAKTEKAVCDKDVAQCKKQVEEDLNEFQSLSRKEGTEGYSRKNIEDKEGAVEKAKTEFDRRKDDYDNARSKQMNDSNIVGWRLSEAKWRTIGDMTAAIGNSMQAFFRGFADLKHAEATRIGAEGKRADEALDQIKDLFSLAQQVIQSALDLFKSIIQVETSSMQEAIKA